MSTSPEATIDLVASDNMQIAIESLSTANVRRFQPVFNKPGSLSVDVPLDSVVAYKIKKRATGAVLSLDGQPIWSGGATAISKKTGDAGTMSVTFTGWLEELDHRYVRRSEEAALRFPSPGTIGGSILKTMIQTVNAQVDTAGIVRPLHVGFDDFTDTQVRIRSYKAGDSYGALARELSEVENGFDFSLDPISRLITTRPPTSFQDQTRARFYYPGNLEEAEENDDGLSLANRENVVSENGLVVSADDQDAIQTATVMLEDWLSISDVSDPLTIAAYANAELVYKRYGIQTYTLTPKKYADQPMPYKDFFPGDKIYLSVDKGAFQLFDQPVRVFSLGITFDKNRTMIVDQIGVAPE